MVMCEPIKGSFLFVLGREIVDVERPVLMCHGHPRFWVSKEHLEKMKAPFRFSATECFIGDSVLRNMDIVGGTEYRPTERCVEGAS